jgi:hypothetical protein
MKHRMRYLALFCLLAASLLFSASAWAQNVLPGPGWQVTKADWGSGNRWMDVTNQVRRLLTGNGQVKVNNTNMGGDPAVGADKILRIRAVNSSRQSRQFTFKEGDYIDSRQFYNYAQGPGYRPNPGYPGGNPGYPGGNPGYPGGNPGYPGGGNNSLQITRAYYGLNNRTMDVTRSLQSMSRNGTLVVQVNNNTMGGDPAKGADKVLTVIYRYQGRERTSTVKEGNTLRIP